MKAAALGMAMLLVGLVGACSSGDGVPRASVINETDKCLVEAAWVDDESGQAFGFYYPLAHDGQTAPREVTVGHGYGYAVLKSMGDCYSAATQAGGDVYKTNDPVTMSQGQTSLIVFSPTTSHLADPSDYGLFARTADAGTTD